jgi:hypothetical protein
MRQGQVITSSALFLLCVVATAAARQGNPTNVGGTSTTTSSTSTGTTTTTKTTTHKKAVHCTFKGTVVSVDQANKSFVVHPAKGEDVTINVDDKSKYNPKVKCSWDDIKVGAKVSGTCKNDGVYTWAITVKCWPAAKAKAEPAAGNPRDVGGTARTGTGTG